jgi:hypothetical protein
VMVDDTTEPLDRLPCQQQPPTIRRRRRPGAAVPLGGHGGVSQGNSRAGHAARSPSAGTRRRPRV